MADVVQLTLTHDEYDQLVNDLGNLIPAVEAACAEGDEKIPATLQTQLTKARSLLTALQTKRVPRPTSPAAPAGSVVTVEDDRHEHQLADAKAMFPGEPKPASAPTQPAKPASSTS
jgi:hypothetical protein